MCIRDGVVNETTTLIQRASRVDRRVIATIPRPDIEGAVVIDFLDRAAAQVHGAVAAVESAIFIRIATDGNVTQRIECPPRDVGHASAAVVADLQLITGAQNTCPGKIQRADRARPATNDGYIATRRSASAQVVSTIAGGFATKFDTNPDLLRNRKSSTRLIDCATANAAAWAATVPPDIQPLVNGDRPATKID